MLQKNLTEPQHLVLYADDDPDDQLIVKDAFSTYAHNYELVTVSNGLQALNYLENIKGQDKTPCLVILDINMPRMTGKEALKNIRKMDGFSDMAVVLYTTSAQPADQVFAQDMNAGFMTKPHDFNRMNLVVEKFLEFCNGKQSSSN